MRCSKAGAISRLSCCFLLAGLASGQQQHDRELWREIARHHYEVPNGESASALAGELSAMLASPDPEMRDDLAYSILARWIYRGNLDADALRKLADEWIGNLKEGVGESGTNSVLKRSFSALCLASIAERDVKVPVLGAVRYHELVRKAIDYLRNERDLRGYDQRLGWIHATAHTSDLLQALASNSLLKLDEGSEILEAIAQRLDSAPEVYTQGEQDRMVQAILAVIKRTDFKKESFNLWIARVQREDQETWAQPLTQQSLARYQNHTYALQALAVRLDLEPESSKVAAWRQQLLTLLKSR
jgi:Protein of unknown function (DUF2785)